MFLYIFLSIKPCHVNHKLLEKSNRREFFKKRSEVALLLVSELASPFHLLPVLQNQRSFRLSDETVSKNWTNDIAIANYKLWKSTVIFE